MAGSRIELGTLGHVQVAYMNAKYIGFPEGSFDIALCGFMGWDDCFDFNYMKFNKPDKKGPEIYRILRDGAKFFCCSWEAQEDVTWMEEAVLRHYPAIVEDPEYIEDRPIGMSYEKAEGYVLIFREAGFKDIEMSTCSMTFVSTDEEEWWRQMRQIGWDSFLDKINDDQLRRVKDAIFNDLQIYRHTDGIYFEKSAFIVSGRK